MSAPVQTSTSETGRLFARLIRDGRDDRLVEMIENAREESGVTAEELFVAIRQTSSRLVRNAAALAVADLKPRGGAEILAEVLGDPSIAHEAGTLIYALDELGGSLPLPTFVMLLESGSYEARAEALNLLDEGRVLAPSEDEVDAALVRLVALAAVRDGNAAEAATAALANWPERWSARS